MARNTGKDNRDRLLNRKEKKPIEAKEMDNSQKGIKLFFSEKERRFFENAGREITEEILQESFILYRIDYKKTRTHDLYGESKKKVHLSPIEVYGRINVEAQAPEYMTPGGLIRKGYGIITASVYLTHLDELGAQIRMGDYMYFKGNYYEVTDDGSSNIDNQHAWGGDKHYSITVKGVEVNSDVFQAR
jgi:hypothetical protein